MDEKIKNGLGRRQLLALSAVAVSATAVKALPAEIGKPSLPVGYLSAEGKGALRDASSVPADDLIMQDARVTVSGHLLGVARKASLDVYFGANGQYPFHAWACDEISGSAGNAVTFTVPMRRTGGLKLQLELDGKSYELAIDEMWSGPRLRRGSYVIALDKKGRTPRWSRIRSLNPRTDDLGLSVRLPHVLVTVEAV